MTKKEKSNTYTKYIDHLMDVPELVTDNHDKVVKTLMYTNVLHYIKQRKLRDKIEDNSNDDICPPDIYDFLDDFILDKDHEDKRKGQINIEKYAKTIKKSKSTKPDKPDKPRSKSKKLNNSPVKLSPLKLSVNIQPNWIFNMQYFELAMFKEILPMIKTRTDSAVLAKMTDEKIPIYKFMHYVSETTLRIDDTKTDTESDEETTFIENLVDELTKIYKTLLPEKNNTDLDSHLATVVSKFIKVLAFHAEVSVWHSTTSKSCNQIHFITAVDTFRRQTNIPVPFDLLRFSIMYGTEKTKKKSSEDKIRTLKQ